MVSSPQKQPLFTAFIDSFICMYRTLLSLLPVPISPHIPVPSPLLFLLFWGLLHLTRTIRFKTNHWSLTLWVHDRRQWLALLQNPSLASSSAVRKGIGPYHAQHMQSYAGPLQTATAAVESWLHWQSHLQKTAVLAFYFCDKALTKNNLERKGFIWHTCLDQGWSFWEGDGINVLFEVEHSTLILSTLNGHVDTLRSPLFIAKRSFSD